MSSQEALNAAIGTCLELTATTLFCYDLFLTISAEITYIWKPKFSPTTYCYFVNRYIMLANRGVRLAGLVLWNHRAFKHADDVCNVAWRLSEAFTMTMHLAMAAFSAIRIYATCNKSHVLAALVMGAGCVGPGVMFYYDFQLVVRAQRPPSIGCRQDSTVRSTVGNTIFLAIGSAFIFLMEALVLISTWAKTAPLALALRRLRIRSPISVVLWKDGAVYSIILLVLAGLNFLSVGMMAWADIPALTDVLFSVALSRFILRLRGLRAVDTEPTRCYRDSSVRFRCFSPVEGSCSCEHLEDRLPSPASIGV